MSRDVETIKSELLDLAPSWLFGDTDAGAAIATALAKALAVVEEAFEGLQGLLHRQSSSGQHIEDLAVDRGVEPLPWEGEKQLRDLATVHPQAPTPDHVVQELNRRLRREGYGIDYVEPHWRVTIAGDAAIERSDAGLYTSPNRPQSVSGGQRFQRIVVIQAPAPETVASADNGLYPGNPDHDYTDQATYLEPDRALEWRRDVFVRIDRWLDGMLPPATPYLLELKDTAELAHYDSLLSMQSGGVT